MKVCIVSDSHDRADALARALREAKEAGAAAAIHCGDLIGAQTLKPALALGLVVHLIRGNNVGDSLALHHMSRGSGGLLQYLGADARVELDGRRVFVVHYPEYGYGDGLHRRLGPRLLRRTRTPPPSSAWPTSRAAWAQPYAFRLALPGNPRTAKACNSDDEIAGKLWRPLARDAFIRPRQTPDSAAACDALTLIVPKS